MVLITKKPSIHLGGYLHIYISEDQIIIPDVKIGCFLTCT